jgi:hypothetical protein
LRWEFHPGYHDASGNIGNFDPNYPKSGAIIYPDGYSSLLDPGLVSTNPCPLGQKTGGVTLNGAPLRTCSLGQPGGLAAKFAYCAKSLHASVWLRLQALWQ